MSEPRIPFEGAQEKPLDFFGETSMSVEALGGDPLVSIGPIRMRGTVTFIDPEYHLDAEIPLSAELACGRCLEPYRFEETLPVRLRLRKRPEPPRRPEKARPGAPAEEVELEVDASDLDVVLYDEPVVPFDDIVREQVLMAIPMKPLCREDCRGLCPECGADWNSGDCACEKIKIDPRLEVLKGLK
jgi:uncharacterized protein